MSDKSTIECTGATWNPVRGCTKISPGCAHCYAETFAERFRGVPGHPDEYIEAVVQVMRKANWHTYQVLTKRSERMRDLLQSKLREVADESYIWWGVSVDNRRHGLPRIEHLRSAPARMRFLSVEPLLEDLGPLDLGGIDWVIVGGESGHGARPMDPDRVGSIRDQWRSAGVPFFFKQWGGLFKKRNGRELDGRTYDEIPERSDQPIPNLARRREMIGEV